MLLQLCAQLLECFFFRQSRLIWFPSGQEMDHPNGRFTLHDGPPYANGSLHMGGCLTQSKCLSSGLTYSEVHQESMHQGCQDDHSMRVVGVDVDHFQQLLSHTVICAF